MFCTTVWTFSDFAGNVFLYLCYSYNIAKQTLHKNYKMSKIAHIRKITEVSDLDSEQEKINKYRKRV